MAIHIMVVDDEKGIRKSLTDVLEDEKYTVTALESGEEALDKIDEDFPDLVMLDIWLPGIDGIATLERIKKIRPELPIIMISGHGNIETAVRALKLGAYDFIEKPLHLEKILRTVSNALERQRLERENKELREKIEKTYQIIGETSVMKDLKKQIAIAAPTNGRVLIYGENGTGKELVARAIHSFSFRKDKPFVEVNCAAIPEELIESELFGHEKGAFTGAISRRKGKFELANGGTIFLDEVGDMSLKTQAKVLRVLQEQSFERVGGTDTIKVDVRVITASNKDLEVLITEGRFREDLYFRLNVIPIEVPPLRRRREDIPMLVNHFLREISVENGKKVKSIALEAMEYFIKYEWPGNVRELQNMIERLVIMSPSDVIGIEDLPASLIFQEIPEMELIARDKPLKEAREEFERKYILTELKANEWNITKTAEKLRIERSHLHKKMRSLKINSTKDDIE